MSIATRNLVRFLVVLGSLLCASCASTTTVMFKQHGALYPIALSSVRRTIVTAGGELTLWDIAAGSPIAVVKEPAKAVAISKSGSLIAAVFRSTEGNSIRYSLRTFDGATLKPIRSVDVHESESVAISLDDTHVACGTLRGSVLVFRLPGLERVAELKLSEGSDVNVVNALAFIPGISGLQLAAGYSSSEIRLWSVVDQRTITTMHGHSTAVESLAVSPDGRLLVSGSAGKNSHESVVLLWSLPDGKYLRLLGSHDKDVAAVAFSESGTLVASGGCDGQIFVWDAATGTLKRKFGDDFLRSGKTQIALKAPGPIELTDGLPAFLSSSSDKTWYRGLAFLSDDILVSGSDDALVTWPLK